MYPKWGRAGLCIQDGLKSVLNCLALAPLKTLRKYICITRLGKLELVMTSEGHECRTKPNKVVGSISSTFKATARTFRGQELDKLSRPSGRLGDLKVKEWNQGCIF